jgi:hypothetical protein
MSDHLPEPERQAYRDLGVPDEALDTDPAEAVEALRRASDRYRAEAAALNDMIVRPMPDPHRGSIECLRCAAVAMIPDLSVATIRAAALAHLADCPPPHQEPPPSWRDITDEDRAADRLFAARFDDRPKVP